MKKPQCDEAGEFGICPYVTAQKLLQGKWAILILYSLSGGAKRFKQLQREIDINQTTLVIQLKALESEGLIHRELFPEVPLRVEYSLTDMGREFQPVLDSLEIWGNKYIEFLNRSRKNK